MLRGETLANLQVLGIFEDQPQSDFVATLAEKIAPLHGHQLTIERRLTAGCRYDYLNDHLKLADQFDGVLIGVDGAGLSRPAKIAKLQAACPSPALRLWSIACPSVEEWLMADIDALPGALRELFGPGSVRHASRPGRANSERTAKQRLRGWVEGLLGAPALQGGVEYAADVALKTEAARIGNARNADLKELLEVHLPSFLTDCAAMH